MPARTRGDLPMTGPIMRCKFFVVLAILLFAPMAPPAPGCPFCGMSGNTLTQEMDQSVMVLYGTLRNARLVNPNADGLGMGETDLVLDKTDGVIKQHEYVAGKDVITLPKYLPTNKNDPVKVVIFCDVFRRQLDPYRGMPVR